MLRRLAIAVSMLFVLVAAGCGDDGQIGAVDSDAPADYAYVIPLGAGEALDAGTPLEILPARLDAEVGEVIEIVNEDERGHLIGPYFVGAGETLRQEFASSGEFIGECTVHPSGQIVVVVT